jgi:hypothetical protein
MGWSESVAGSHARRLAREGWLERHRMTRGEGSLLLATRRGVRMCDLAVTAPPAPAPTWWSHDCACAWTAAWLTVRGAEWHGPREVLRDPGLGGQVEWQTRTGWRRSAHRPDLAVAIPEGRVVVEVELQRKAHARLEAILTMYRRWRDESRIAGVVYICDGEKLAERIREHCLAAGLPPNATRIELLDDVRAQSAGARS